MTAVQPHTDHVRDHINRQQQHCRLHGRHDHGQQGHAHHADGGQSAFGHAHKQGCQAGQDEREVQIHARKFKRRRRIFCIARLY